MPFVRTIFLSSHFPKDSSDTSSTSRWRDIAEEILNNHGFRMILIDEEEKGTITEKILDYLRQSAGFIQFWTLRTEEKRRFEENRHGFPRPDFGWLDGEYLSARILELPSKRFFNTYGTLEPPWREWTKFDLEQASDSSFDFTDIAEFQSTLEKKLKPFLERISV